METWPFGLVIFTVQLSAVVDVLMVICTSVLFTKLTSPELRVFEPPVHVTATVDGLAKPVPLMEMVCKLLDPVTELPPKPFWAAFWAETWRFIR